METIEALITIARPAGDVRNVALQGHAGVMSECIACQGVEVESKHQLPAMR